MAKREFNLPGIQDLSKEQEDARALPKQGQHLIIGGPGTGKSVLALLRARRHREDKDNYVFLVYNKLLNQASRQLFGRELCSQQWQSWFASIFKAAAGEAIPKLPPNGNGWQEIDWVRTSEIIAASPHLGHAKRPFLIIDEGQDMPPEFYQALFNLGFENVYAVADQNQQIVPGQNSTRQEIQNGLGIAPNDVIELQDNYRNSYPIARLAREFYTGDPASPPPALPNRPSAIRPILHIYEQSDFQNLIERILKNADMAPEKLIGLIAPDNKTRERYFEALMKTKATVKFDNGPPAVQTYSSGSSPAIHFNEGGIMVINAQSCKGLEFDTVFLADINQHFCNTQNQDKTKRLFYVMVARAKEGVITLKEAGKHCPVDAILPQDNEILERQ
ncbi:MAG: ATP-binding domain-containing protein [Sulfurisoma sp.]|nr:ATP-binding domain-containing protein [Sulfurisoma sp.]